MTLKSPPPYGKTIQNWSYHEKDILLQKAQELGRFNMGSTVVLLLPKNAPKLAENLAADDFLKMGQALS